MKKPVPNSSATSVSIRLWRSERFRQPILVRPDASGQTLFLGSAQRLLAQYSWTSELAGVRRPRDTVARSVQPVAALRASLPIQPVSKLCSNT